MTRIATDRVPWPKPANYDSSRYELLARYLTAKPGLKFGNLCNPVAMPNGKTDTNNNGPFSTDHIGANYDYPDGDAATRTRIWQDHVDYTQGFFYFLHTSPGSPPALQRRDQFMGPGEERVCQYRDWPPQLYVRRGPPMVGAYVMTQSRSGDRTKPDPVVPGSFNLQSSHGSPTVTRADESASNEGDFQVPVKTHMPIPISKPPRRKQRNASVLLTCRCAALASHVGYGTIRMDACIVVRHSSGIAASWPPGGLGNVSEVSVEILQGKLKVRRPVVPGSVK